MAIFGVIPHGYAMLYAKMFHGYDKMKHLLKMNVMSPLVTGCTVVLYPSVNTVVVEATTSAPSCMLWLRSVMVGVGVLPPPSSSSSSLPQAVKTNDMLSAISAMKR